MNYWYVARANELFIDTDNVSRSIKHTKARLQGAIECGKLDIAYVMTRTSKSKNHIHTIITLNRSICYVERYAWEIILHGDIYRSACNLMRSLNNVSAPDVLISPFANFIILDPVREIIRMSDDKCDCDMKHDAWGMMQCPAAHRLRGKNRTIGFFGKPSKNPCTIWPEK